MKKMTDNNNKYNLPDKVESELLWVSLILQLSTTHEESFVPSDVNR